ncbi:MAG: fasciclin domain-containing protein [Roseobacter sp.]
MFRKTLFALTAATAIAGTALVAGTASAKKDIVDTAVTAGTFETLVAAVSAAELVDTLKGDGPFTVFAPTDEAFAALPEGTVETLLLPENKAQLIEILTYHVVPGKVMSTDLSDDMTAETVQGSEITIDLDDGVKINEATVTAADIETSNGVIHVIDAVILPPQS